MVVRYAFDMNASIPTCHAAVYICQCLVCRRKGAHTGRLNVLRVDEAGDLLLLYRAILPGLEQAELDARHEQAVCVQHGLHLRSVSFSLPSFLTI